ncbi:MAG: dephospho-CoA kinase [Hyphomicrobiales bacterium]|nr:dephospho-CoA kinase [Hyphomicrobiales bacterium]
MLRIGLTGSIGTGKSTTAKMFAERGIPIFNADAAVHGLYQGAAAPLIEKAFPGTTKNGVVDRNALSERILDDANALKVLEAIVHPLVREAQDSFANESKIAGDDMAVYEIPLLFETGSPERFDAIVVTTVDPDIQKGRVLERPGMTGEKLKAILKRQLPDHEKRKRADFIVDTSQGFERAREQVDTIIAELKQKIAMP